MISRLEIGVTGTKKEIQTHGVPIGSFSSGPIRKRAGIHSVTVLLSCLCFDFPTFKISQVPLIWAMLRRQFQNMIPALRGAIGKE